MSAYSSVKVAVPALVSVDVCVLLRCHDPPAMTQHWFLSESSGRVLRASVIHRLHAGVARPTNRGADPSRVEQVRTSTFLVMLLA